MQLNLGATSRNDICGVNVKTFVTYLGAALLAMANPRWSTAQVHLVGVMPTVDVGMPLDSLCLSILDGRTHAVTQSGWCFCCIK